MQTLTNERMKELKTYLAIDLYNIALATEDSILKRYILAILHGREEHDLVYSIGLNSI